MTSQAPSGPPSYPHSNAGQPVVQLQQGVVPGGQMMMARPVMMTPGQPVMVPSQPGMAPGQPMMVPSQQPVMMASGQPMMMAPGQPMMAPMMVSKHFIVHRSFNSTGTATLSADSGSISLLCAKDSSP